jgi:hypothetical protein
MIKASKDGGPVEHDDAERGYKVARNQGSTGGNAEIYSGRKKPRASMMFPSSKMRKILVQRKLKSNGRMLGDGAIRRFFRCLTKYSRATVMTKRVTNET